MRLSDFDYNLPKKLIAQKPISPRDHSRLLIIKKNQESKIKNQEYIIKHKHFHDLISYLNKGDVLVLNNSKVIPARLMGNKKETGGRIEVFLLNKNLPSIPSLVRRGNTFSFPLLRGRLGGGEMWSCLVGGRGAKEGLEIKFKNSLEGKILKNNKDGTWEVGFNKAGAKFQKIINQIGHTPLPPYIKKELSKEDQKNYQTIYADQNKAGSVAAPTAGLHFTPHLLKKLKVKGVQIEYITLHVGLGTFAPVKTNDITKHKMHSEYFEIDKKTINNILKAKKEGRRIIAVGTTSVRVLETVYSKFQISIPSTRDKFQNNSQISNFKNKIDLILLPQKNKGKNLKIKNYTNIFIYPGYKFKIIDGLITNFHLPKSTLLMLVAAFLGNKFNFSKEQSIKITKELYGEAIKNKYRFYSYGDAMLIV